MGGAVLSSEKTRVFSIVIVIGLAGGLFAFLFHDTPTVDIRLEGPSAVYSTAPVAFSAQIEVPPGQRLPLAAVALVIQDPSTTPPRVLDVVTCWTSDPCGETVVHAGPNMYEGITIQPAGQASTLSSGPLSVWVRGYGHSPATGYGTEVEPERRLVARDSVDPSGLEGHGMGYEGQTLQFNVTLAPGQLGPGEYRLAFIADTGSRDMGTISGPIVELRVLSEA